MVKRYSHLSAPEWLRHLSVVTLPAGIKHYYRNLQQAERLMKQGVDESFAHGIRLDEWEDDGSDEFDGTWKKLQGMMMRENLSSKPAISRYFHPMQLMELLIVSDFFLHKC